MSIVVFNAGSSSLKYGLFDDDAREITTGVVESTDIGNAVSSVLAAIATNHSSARVTAVGQRVVHGGVLLSSSVRIDELVKATIARLTPLAPLHQGAALESIDAVSAALPAIPQIAVFDTAFFATLAPVHYVYPLPHAWHEAWGIRRFGFHGISHAYCSARAATLLDRRDAPALRVITCHLGQGCSASATRDGIAVATTMGFTPQDGLMMGTRPGSLDPGILSYVQRERGVTLAELERVMNHGAGLLGVSGVSSDYRDVETAALAGNARARLALEIYAARVREAIGALAVTLCGVDALVFTAGVGEHSASLRAAVCEGLACLGLHLDARKNAAAAADADVATDDSAGRILVMHTREETMIAREVAAVLGSAFGSSSAAGG